MEKRHTQTHRAWRGDYSRANLSSIRNKLKNNRFEQKSRSWREEREVLAVVVTFFVTLRLSL